MTKPQDDFSNNINVSYSSINDLKHLQKKSAVAFSLFWSDHISPIRKGYNREFAGVYTRCEGGLWSEECVTSAFVCLISGGEIAISFKKDL
jgi:hypothetical protein